MRSPRDSSSPSIAPTTACSTVPVRASFIASRCMSRVWCSTASISATSSGVFTARMATTACSSAALSGCVPPPRAVGSRCTVRPARSKAASSSGKSARRAWASMPARAAQSPRSGTGPVQTMSSGCGSSASSVLRPLSQSISSATPGWLMPQKYSSVESCRKG